MDYENRMAEAATRKQKVRYKVDALGRRVQRIVGSGKENTKFIHDGNDVLVDDDSGTLTKYLNGEGIDAKLRVQQGSTVNYFLADHLGSTNGLADSSGAITSQTAYDSFGNQTGTLPTRYGFTGRERDDFTGLMYYRARLYDPNLGRFVSEDPIGLFGGINLYGYVNNQPLVMRDPNGKIPVVIPAAIIVGGLILSSPSYVNAPGPRDPVYDNRNDVVANAVIGCAGGLAIRTLGGALLSTLLRGAGDDIIELGIAGGPTRGTLSNPIINSPRSGSGLTDDFVRPRFDSSGTITKEFPATPKAHGFPDMVDNYAHLAQRFQLRNGAELFQLSGSNNGVAGRFEWILDRGFVTHRMFVAGGSINGVPIVP